MEEVSMETEQIDNTSHEAPANDTAAACLQPVESFSEPFHLPLFTSKTLLELSNTSWSRSVGIADFKVQPYLRGCKWSPDGTCCLSVVNDDGMHVTELSRDLYSGEVKSDRKIDVMDSVIHVKEAGMIYDFCWYPGMNSAVPETCCWLSTRQNGPIQMWDAYDGSLRCTYRGFNWVDEMENAFSITFTTDGNRIIAGYKKTLKTFDVQRPGRDYTEHRISCPASCLATSGNLLAVGSWNTTITLYSDPEMGTHKSIGKMHGHGGGVTHMKFTPDGLNLVTGARKDHRLLVWDIRHFRRPLNILSRPNTTNQRIYFDISRCGKYLVSGATDGVVKVWDVDHVDWKNSLDSVIMADDNVTYKFPLHKDCCNSISIHPLLPIIATGSGQIHLEDPSSEDCSTLQTSTVSVTNDAGERENNKSNDETTEIKTKDFTNKVSHNNAKDDDKHILDMKYSSYAENSLVFWWIGDVPGLISQ